MAKSLNYMVSNEVLVRFATEGKVGDTIILSTKGQTYRLTITESEYNSNSINVEQIDG